MNAILRRLLMLPEQASTMAADMDALHYVVISVTMLGATAVALTALVYILRYRQRPATAGMPSEGEAHGEGPRVSLRLELALVGGLAALFTAFWVLGFRQYLQLRTPPADALPIYGTGKQWMWSFAYPSGAATNGVLYVPTQQPVKMLLTSRDVIHSFFVPAFRVKEDVIPGRITTAWFSASRIGRYDLYCAEYCGLEHSRMRAVVVVLSKEDFQREMEQLTEPVTPEAGARQRTDMASRGERAAARHGCLRCHTLDGTPHIGPTWAGLYDSEVPLQRGGTARADESYLTASMMDPLRDIHAGFAAVMPSYQGMLSTTDTGSIVELIRSLRHAEDTRQAPLPLQPIDGVPQQPRGPFDGEPTP